MHLLVQAGTGTGKSLGYLVPALLHDDRVVVATATLALQHQLVERDIPALVEASKHVLHETPTYAVLKGRSNYACLHRIREGVPDDQGALVERARGVDGVRGAQAPGVGRGGVDRRRRGRPRLRAPAHRPGLATGVGHAPRVPGRGEVPLRAGVLRRAGEGARGPVAPGRHQPLAAGDRRDRGRPHDPRVRRGGDRRGARARLAGHPGRDRRAVAGAGGAGCPPGRADTSAATRPTTWPTPATPCATHWPQCEPGRLEPVPDDVHDALVLVRDAARAAVSAFGKDSADDAGATQAKGWVQEVFATAERMAAGSDMDVMWMSDREANRGGVAPEHRPAAGVGAVARQAAGREDRGVHQRDPQARR